MLLSQVTHRSARVIVALTAMVLCVVGCSEEDTDSVFTEMSRLPAPERLVEIELGHFSVPVPIVLESATDRFEPGNLMEVQFQLFAIVDPAKQKRVERLVKRNEGRLRDRVIRVCRETPRDDLVEAQWSTLKAHLLDALQPLLGGPAVRRLGVTKVLKDEL